MRIDQSPNKPLLSVIDEKMKDSDLPGLAIPFTDEEFELAGGFEDEAYEFEDARLSMIYPKEVIS